MTRPSFNLIEEPWIRAVDRDGSLQEYSLRDLLTRAHALNAIYDDSPLVVAALLRMILALLHRVYRGPRNRHEWQEVWQGERFDTGQLADYFGEWSARFELFDVERPFYQSIDAGVDGQDKPITSLMPQLATGNNATLFDHTTDDGDFTLSCAQAARTLAAAQAFGLAGPCNPKLKLYFTDGTCARGIIFLAEGNSLFETLVLNLIEYPSQLFGDQPDDRPAWEMDDSFFPQREVPLGYLDYLTWQNRRILLIPQTANGRIVVRSVAHTPGLKLDAGVLSRDSMKHYRIDEKRGHISMRFNENRAVWRDSATLLRFSANDQQPPAVFEWLARLASDRKPVLDESLSLDCMALGMASDQAKVEFFRSEHLPVPLVYLENERFVDLLSIALTTAEQVASEIWKATGTMANVLLAPEEGGERKANPDDVRDLRANMGAERRYWSVLEPHFRVTVQAIPLRGSDALVEWFDALRRAAWRAFDEVSDGLGDDPRALKAAVRGREQLARGLSTVLKIDE